MIFEDTYAEYQWLRVQLGYTEANGYAGTGFVRKVWDGCEPAAQENMLQQLRDGLTHQNRYVVRHGEVW